MLCIRKPEEAIDLFMVEIMHMRHKFDVDTRLVIYTLCLLEFAIFVELFEFIELQLIWNGSCLFLMITSSFELRQGIWLLRIYVI